MKSFWVGASASVLLVIVGCAGGTGGIGGSDGGASSSSGGGSSSGGADGGGGGSDGGGCSTIQIPGVRTCVPRTAKANTVITLEVEGKSCLGCGSTFAPCKVAVEGFKIFVQLEATQCPLPENMACDLSCAIPRTTCTIPPLAIGGYRLDIGGGVQSSTDEPRMLVVTDKGEPTTSCSLPQGEPPPISPNEFPRACTPGNDNECSLVIEGDVCKPCVCPSGAIAASAFQDYEAERSARRAACTSGGSPSCIACADNKVAKCVAGTCTVVAK